MHKREPMEGRKERKQKQPTRNLENEKEHKLSERGSDLLLLPHT